MTEPIAFIPLDQIQVATPCRASWEDMRGSASVRFCQTCAKNVYNLSAMSRADVEALVAEKEGNLCARFYQRQDGTLLTSDCPVGLHAHRRGLLQGLAAGFVASVAFAGGLIGISQGASRGGAPRTLESLRNTQPFKMMLDRISPPPPIHVTTGMVLITVHRTPPPAPVGQTTSAS